MASHSSSAQGHSAVHTLVTIRGQPAHLSLENNGPSTLTSICATSRLSKSGWPTLATTRCWRGFSATTGNRPARGRDVDDVTRWVDLSTCSLTLDGFHSPGVEQARALRGTRRAERTEAARLKAEETARRRQADDIERNRKAEVMERQFEAAAVRARDRNIRPPREVSHPDGPVGPTSIADPYPMLSGLDRWEAVNPEAAHWQPEGGWGWLDGLPSELHREARALAFATQVLSFAWTTEKVLKELTDPTVRQRLFDVLEEVGMVWRERHPLGHERWERVWPWHRE